MPFSMSGWPWTTRPQAETQNIRDREDEPSIFSSASQQTAPTTSRTRARKRANLRLMPQMALNCHHLRLSQPESHLMRCLTCRSLLMMAMRIHALPF